MPSTDRTLILVRHARSSRPDHRLADHDRPLNDRGIRDAPLMVGRLAERGPMPEAIVSSSATRALSTATRFATELGLASQAVTVEPAIYGAGTWELLEIVRGLDEGLDHVLLVGHNPTISELASLLGGVELGGLPTGAVVTLRWTGGPWKEVAEGALELLDVDYPNKVGGESSSGADAP